MLPVRTRVPTFENKGAQNRVVFGVDFGRILPRVMKNPYVLRHGTPKIMVLKTGHFLFIRCLIRDDFRPESTKSENRGAQNRELSKTPIK